MKTIEEALTLVIETAWSGVSQMPRDRESEAERAIYRVESLLRRGWRLCPPETQPEREVTS